MYCFSVYPVCTICKNYGIIPARIEIMLLKNYSYQSVCHTCLCGNNTHIKEKFAMQRFLDKILSVMSGFLPEKLIRYAKIFLTVQFLTFLIIGAVNTLSTTGFAAVLDRVHPSGQDNRVNFILGYCASLILSFFLNTRFTFRKKPTLKSFVKFPVSYIPNFVIQYLSVWLFTALSLNNTLAYLIAAIIGIPVTFLTMKFFVY